MSQIIDVELPDIGDFKDVEVIEVLIKPGDTVAKEQSLIIVGSDTASMEIPSPAAGVVEEVRVKPGDKVSHGSPLIRLQSGADPAASAVAPAPASAPRPAPPKAALKGRSGKTTNLPASHLLIANDWRGKMNKERDKGEELDGRATYPRWVESAAETGPIFARAGHPIEFRASDFLPHVAEPGGVRWNVNGEVFKGDRLRWVPRSPGDHVVTLREGKRRATFNLRVGLAPSDLTLRRDHLDYFFCLVGRVNGKLLFAPLIGEDPDCGPSDASMLGQELAHHHPALCEFMRAHAKTYLRFAAPLRQSSLATVMPGLYAVFPRKTVFLGTHEHTSSAVKTVVAAIDGIARTGLGRGLLLRDAQEQLDSLAPLRYR